MRKHLVTAVALATAAVTTASFGITTAQAQAAPRGTTSLAEVLAADGLEFDDSWKDFDILDQAVNEVVLRGDAA